MWRRVNGTAKQKQLLSEWPVSKTKNYLFYLNEPQNEKEEQSIQNSILRSSPFGKSDWVEKVVMKFNLESTIRPKGRPKKGD